MKLEPINLRPLLMPILVLGMGPSSIETIVERLPFSKRRANAILNALISLNLVKKYSGLYHLTGNGNRLHDEIKQNRWHLIHDFLEANHEAYKVLNMVIRKGYQVKIGEGIPRTKIGDYEKKLFGKDETRRFMLTNDVIIGFLIDWGERLGKIMENKLSDIPRLFSLVRNQPNEEDHYLLRLPYLKLSGTGLGKRPYVSIPLLREFSCETLRVSRLLFDAMLINAIQEKPKSIRLIGAPETTLSIKGANSIKSILYSANDMLEVESSPLYGLKVNNRYFYYMHMEVDEL